MIKVRIVRLLTQADYEAWWAGENGSDGYATDNVESVRKIAESCGSDGSVYIWEQGNAYVEIDVLKANLFEALVREQLDSNYELSTF